MKLSNDTIKVMEFLDNFSDNNIRKRSDVGLIFEICASFNLHEILNRFIFTSKSVWKLSRSLKNSSPEQQGSDLLKTELGRQIDDMKKLLSQIIDYSDEPQSSERFANIYFQLTSGSLKNLTDLAHDFAIVKDLQSQKYGK